MKHVKCMTGTPIRQRPHDPHELTQPASQPVDRPTDKYGNVSAGFGLANLLQRITNAHAKPSHWLTAMAYSKVACVCECVCVSDLIRVRAAR